MSDSIPYAVAVIEAEANGGGPASMGAHRFGWWLAERRSITVAAEHVALLCGEPLTWLERVLLGEIEPGEDECQQIAIGTAGAVLPEDWGLAGPSRWHHAPERRETPKPRRLAA